MMIQRALLILALLAIGQAMGGEFVQDGEVIGLCGGSNFKSLLGPDGTETMVRAGLRAAKRNVKLQRYLGDQSTSGRLLASLDTFLQKSQPTWLVLYIGHSELASDDAFSALKDNLAAIVGKLKAAKIRPVLATLIEPAKADPRSRKSRPRFAPCNDFLRALAKEQGCVLVDVHAAGADLLKRHALNADDPWAILRKTSGRYGLNIVARHLFTEKLCRALFAPDTFAAMESVWASETSCVADLGLQLPLGDYLELRRIPVDKREHLLRELGPELHAIISESIR